jgi:hypothetical protein
VAAALAGDATTSVASNAAVETSANARDLNDVVLISLAIPSQASLDENKLISQLRQYLNLWCKARM